MDGPSAARLVGWCGPCLRILWGWHLRLHVIIRQRFLNTSWCSLYGMAAHGIMLHVIPIGTLPVCTGFEYLVATDVSAPSKITLILSYMCSAKRASSHMHTVESSSCWSMKLSAIPWYIMAQSGYTLNAFRSTMDFPKKNKDQHYCVDLCSSFR